MRFLLNVIWFLLSGLWLAIAYALIGALLCVTVILLPFGLQMFKLAGYVLWPFGRSAVRTGELPGVSTLGNLLWLPAGIVLALVHLGAAIACAVTIIGIPFAIANLKFVGLALTPFGRSIVADRELTNALAAHRASSALHPVE